jgi:hypothetical protein
MKLITEVIEDGFQILQEENDPKKSLHISGIFMQSDVKNRNGRVYPKAIMEKEVNRYVSTHVKNNRALGELSHPNSPKINEDRVSHMITELKQDGSNFVGKAKILSTPMGNIARALIEDGVKIGVSSRGLGSLKEKNGVNEVQSDYYLASIDIVTDPSGPNCFVNGIMEGVDFWYDPSKGVWLQTQLDTIAEQVEETRKEVKRMTRRQIAEGKLQFFENYLNKLKLTD